MAERATGDEPFSEPPGDDEPFSFDLDLPRNGSNGTEAPEGTGEPVEDELDAETEGAAEPKKRKRSRWRGETMRRILWAIPWAIFAIVIIAVGGPLFAAAMVGFSFIGLREFFTMTERAKPFIQPAYLAAAAMVLAAYFGGPFQVLLAGLCGIPVLFLFAASRGRLENITYSIAITVLGIFWIGIGFAHIELLRELPDHGAALLIDCLVATIVADTAAYTAGRMFGSRPLSPRISPNKTFEGLLGGLLGGILGFWLAGLYQDWLSGVDALLMGVAVAALAPIGDLFASMIKRDCEIKDTGRIFGPHGGLIDRADAILFTTVATYYLSVALVY